MKTALIILAFLFVAFIAAFFILGIMSKSGEAPGLVSGKLSNCPNKPNCVCSEYKDDANHYIDPMVIPQDIALDSLPILKNIIINMGGTIQQESNNYLAAIFTSSIFGFVDDVEIRLDRAQNTIHIRSGSRVGHGDAGVNKKRTDLLKTLFEKKVSEANQSPKMH